MQVSGVAENRASVGESGVPRSAVVDDINIFSSSMLLHFFFMVFCLPSQVRIRPMAPFSTVLHDVRLSLSTCCNPLSSSSNIILGLPPFFSFPLFPRL